MARQSISLTKPNDEWLKKQVNSEEFTSKSELINHLIRKEREREEDITWIRTKLIEGEQSGYSSLQPDDILAQSKEELRRSGKI